MQTNGRKFSVAAQVGAPIVEQSDTLTEVEPLEALLDTYEKNKSTFTLEEELKLFKAMAQTVDTTSMNNFESIMGLRDSKDSLFTDPRM